VNHHGEIVAAKVTTGNVHDTQPVRELAEGLTDKLYGDKGVSLITTVRKI
ncbi:MAG: IS5 family transposase, partial [Colwellia sp.]